MIGIGYFKRTLLKYKNPIDFFKEYLNLIIIIPALLGGFWQICELVAISPSFLRFFSISQIVPDGLLILLVLILSVLVLYTFGLIFYKSIYNKDSPDTNEQNDKKLENISKGRKFILFLACFCSAIVCGLGYYELSFRSTGLSDNLIILVTYLPLNLLLVSGVVACLVSSVQCLGWDYSKFTEIIVWIIPVAMLFTIFNFAAGFHKTFIFPKELANSNYITAKLKVSDRQYENSEILYMNDKYIFTKKHAYYIQQNEDTIHFETLVVLPFESVITGKQGLSLKYETD